MFYLSCDYMAPIFLSVEVMLLLSSCPGDDFEKENLSAPFSVPALLIEGTGISQTKLSQRNRQTCMQRVCFQFTYSVLWPNLEIIAFV